MVAKDAAVLIFFEFGFGWLSSSMYTKAVPTLPSDYFNISPSFGTASVGARFRAKCYAMKNQKIIGEIKS